MKSDNDYHFNDCLLGKMLDSNGIDNRFYFVNTLMFLIWVDFKEYMIQFQGITLSID